MIRWFQKICLLAVSVALILVITLALALYRLPQGTSFYGRDLGGMTHREARAVVMEVIREISGKQITVVAAEGMAKTFTPEELGIQFDAYPSIFGASHAAAPDALEKRLADYLYFNERSAEGARMAWSDGRWSIIPGQTGFVLRDGEVNRLAVEIRDSLHNADPLEVEAAYDAVMPAITRESLSELERTANAVSARDVEVKLENRLELRIRLTPQWLSADAGEGTLTLNEEKARDWISAFARLYDQEPATIFVRSLEEVVSEYDRQTYKKIVYEGSWERGQKINQQKFLDDLRAIVADPPAKPVIVAEMLDAPPYIVSDIPGLQFPQQLATGRSSFRLGNYPERRINIEKSLSAFRGVIVSPGEELSFNRVTGWITPAKGYTRTKIIVDGEVVEGVGGGVCQSSTTMYRAAIHAGFPIIERRNHSIDVSYYHAYGHGIDAAVYTDSRADLRFRNDFKYPILVNAYLTDNHDAVVEFFGITDGRTVELANIPTGNPLHKQWLWKVNRADGTAEERQIISRYREPKPAVDPDAVALSALEMPAR